VVIYAAAQFRCRHRYIATVEQERLMFVCEQCQHRTELLNLDRRPQPRSVVNFAPQDAAHYDRATATDRYSA
jgi:hypothetical protein